MGSRTLFLKLMGSVEPVEPMLTQPLMRQMASPGDDASPAPLPMASSWSSRTLKNVAYLYDSHSINNEHFYLCQAKPTYSIQSRVPADEHSIHTVDYSIIPGKKLQLAANTHTRFLLTF